MMQYRNVVGRTILNKKKQVISKIDDIVFDPTTGCMKAIIGNNELFLQTCYIIKWLPDIIIEDYNNNESFKNDILTILETGISIMGNKVIDEDNNPLGTVQDIYFDELTNYLTAIVVEKSLLGVLATEHYIVSESNIIEMKPGYIRVKGPFINNALPEL